MKFLNYAFLLCIPLNLIAQSNNPDYNPIKTVATFLKYPYDARGIGIGSTGVSTMADINSMFWNPAKYNHIREDQMENLVNYPKDLGLSLGFNRGYNTFYKNSNFSDKPIYLNFNAYKTIGKQTIATSFRYHRWGETYFTDRDGYTYAQSNPLEVSIDAAYSRKISRVFSFGIAIRYIRSDILRDIEEIEGTPVKPGQSVGFDLAILYRKKLNIKNLDNNLLSFGLNISNIGNKITYMDLDPQDIEDHNKSFIPTNFRLGGSFFIERDVHGFTISADLNKLLVPTTPIYYYDSITSEGYFAIKKGKDPHVNVFKGMIQSFYDAPNGFKEEMQEIYYGVGFEYWYNRLVSVRVGYYNEHKNKGNRKNINLGAGIRYKFIAFDMTYSIILDKPSYGDYSRNNWFFNLIFQINTKKKKQVEG